MKNEHQRYLAFSLNGERYAIALMTVKEVIGAIDVTPMPGTPTFYRGIINLRDKIIPVIDLKLKFGLTETKIHSQSTIMILDIKSHSIGILVDSVDTVLAVGFDDLSAMPQFQSNLGAQFVDGIARVNDGLILLLNVEKALNEKELTEVIENGNEILA